MPENRKEAKSCHDCGLESLGDCENRNKHIPVDENSPPCKFCTRNRKKPEGVSLFISDFYSEAWTLSEGSDSHWSPLIEDPDPQEQALLKLLQGVVNTARR